MYIYIVALLVKNTENISEFLLCYLVKPDSKPENYNFTGYYHRIKQIIGYEIYLLVFF